MRCPWLPILCGALLVLLLTWTAGTAPASASVHTYTETAGQVTYRSRQSLRDRADRAWQAIAFQRLQAGTRQGPYLRLIGFPGAVRLDRQRPLQVQTLTGHTWSLPFVLTPQPSALPVNVGQYDARPLWLDLTTPQPLTLQIPLVNGLDSEVAIAPFVVKEWLQVSTADLRSSPVGASLGKQPQHQSDKL